MSYLKSGFTISLMIIFGRIAGIARDYLILSKWGANYQTDITFALFSIPDAVVNFLMAGAINNTLVPLFSRRTKSDAQLIAIQLAALFFILLSFLLLTYLSHRIISISTSGLSYLNLVSIDRNFVLGIFYPVQLSVCREYL